jgi:hypothetical protein
MLVGGRPANVSDIKSRLKYSVNQPFGIFLPVDGKALPRTAGCRVCDRVLRIFVSDFVHPAQGRLNDHFWPRFSGPGLSG